jgi:D-inositol-3-phosphate glycosyltransferase
LSASGLFGARVTMALFFHPRGGSAHVVRSLVHAAPAQGIVLRLAAGSPGKPGELSHAPTFFAGLDIQPVEIGLDEPQRPAIAFLPTYEEAASPGERFFARVDEPTSASSGGSWRYRALVPPARTSCTSTT